MPSLLAAFSRKERAVSQPTLLIYGPPRGSLPFRDDGSELSLTADYVTVAHSPSIPAFENGRPADPRSLSPSPRRMKLFKRRREPKQPSPQPAPSSSSSSNPPNPLDQSTLSSHSHGHHDGADEPLAPPRRSIFALYASSKDDLDSTLSVQSLPPPPAAPSELLQPPQRPQPPYSIQATASNPDLRPKPERKKSSVFAWAERKRTQSKVSASDRPPLTPSKSSSATTPKDKDREAPPPPLPQPPPDLGSFALKSFRHVRPESPTPSGSAEGPIELKPPSRPPSAMSVYQPPARPRGNSVASESSQRVSVALFREAQARRANGSGILVPSPSPAVPRPPSRLETSPNLRPPPGAGPRMQNRSATSPSPARRPPSLRSTTSSSSLSSTTSEDSAESTMKPARKGTITPNTRKASSELGHLSAPKRQEPAQRSATPSGRQRSSSSAANLTSVSAPPGGPSRHSRAPASISDTSDDDSSSEEDSDDAPLAKLVNLSRSDLTSASRSQPSLPSRSPAASPVISAKSPVTPGKSPAPTTPRAQKRALTPSSNRHTTALDSPTQDVLIDPPPRRSSLETRAVVAAASARPAINTTSLTPDSATHTGASSRNLTNRLAKLTRGLTGASQPSPTGSSQSPLMESPSALSSPQSLSVSSTQPPIVPVPVGHRAPQPAFSVMSRPRSDTASDVTSPSSASGSRPPGHRPAKSTSSSSTNATQPTLVSMIPSDSGTDAGPAHISRPGTLAALIPPKGSISSDNMKVGLGLNRPPLVEAGSSASSTTGSSGRAPYTPRDGSDYGDSRVHKAAGPAVASPQGRAGAPIGRRRPSSEMILPASKSREASEKSEESKRRERRRSEAKASIELGNVVSGREPVQLDEEEQEAPPRNRRESFTAHIPMPPVMNPMMTGMSAFGGFTPSPSGMGWGPTAWPGPMAGAQMPNPAAFMAAPPPIGADAAFLAAHHHAMAIAKQAYQYAVAQQAMAAAAEEWERSTNAGGSVYGGGGGGWGGGGGGFPPAPRSMYAGSVYAGSDAGGWGAQSVYGDAFGPSSSSPAGRMSTYGSRPNLSPHQAAGMQQQRSASNAAVPQTRPTPRSRAKSSPGQGEAPFPGGGAGAEPVPDMPRSVGRKAPPPPSSWSHAR